MIAHFELDESEVMYIISQYFKTAPCCINIKCPSDDMQRAGLGLKVTVEQHKKIEEEEE